MPRRKQDGAGEAAKPAAMPLDAGPAGERVKGAPGWRNRIVGHGEEAPDQIMANPLNWRIHPDDQQRVLAGSLTEIGWAKSVTINRLTGFLVDGHARVILAMRHGEPAVPVEYVELTPAEEAVILATLDPISAMAGADAAIFQQLIEGISTNDAAVEALLQSLSEEMGLGGSGVAGEGEEEKTPAPSLSERFGIPPFSVLDARQGYWQDRKRAWVALGIQSELGRGDNALDISATMAGITDPAERAAWNEGRRGAPRRQPGDNLLGLSAQAEDYRKGQGKYAKGKGRALGHDPLCGEPLADGGPGVILRNGTAPLASQADAQPQTRESKAPATSNGRRPGRFLRQDPMRREPLEDGSQGVAPGRQDGQASTLGSTPGRAGKLLGGSAMDGSWVRRVKGEGFSGLGANSNGTSIFDPVLCELVYRWFCPPDGLIGDPFAGGSVRGIVAAVLGRRYIGIDLRLEQVEANQAQAVEIIGGRGLPVPMPQWVEGVAQDVAPILDGIYGGEAGGDAGIDAPLDLLFTCPPYGDLEVYSNDPDDLSQIAARDPVAFLAAYREIVAQASAKLAQDRFAVFVVGDYRGTDGLYRNFVGETIRAFQDAGLALYNEGILVTAAGSLPIRVGRQFAGGRKLGKTHQNVLVFVKGDWRAAVAACGVVDVEVPLEADEAGADVDDGSADGLRVVDAEGAVIEEVAPMSLLVPPGAGASAGEGAGND